MSKDFLPSWTECERSVKEKTAGAIEQFIYDNEPAENAEVFRISLCESLNEWVGKIERLTKERDELKKDLEHRQKAHLNAIEQLSQAGETINVLIKGSADIIKECDEAVELLKEWLEAEHSNPLDIMMRTGKFLQQVKDEK